MKACSCAKGQDINAQLQIENSFFPKFTRNRGSERGGTFAATMTKLTHIDRKLSKNGDNVTTVLINNNTSSSNGKESPAAMSTFYSQQHERQATVLHTDLWIRDVISQVMSCQRVFSSIFTVHCYPIINV